MPAAPGTGGARGIRCKGTPAAPSRFPEGRRRSARRPRCGSGASPGAVPGPVASPGNLLEPQRQKPGAVRPSVFNQPSRGRPTVLETEKEDSSLSFFFPTDPGSSPSVSGSARQRYL